MQLSCMSEEIKAKKILIYLLYKSLSEDMQITVGEKEKNNHNKDKCGNLVAITLYDLW